MNPTIPQNAVHRVFTVPWIFNDGTYGFKDMPCWVIENPRTDYAEYTEKGTKTMTLKDELKKLYEDSGIEKKRHFFDEVLTSTLKEAAKRGFRYVTIYESFVTKKHGVCMSDIRKWCEDNGLSCAYAEPSSSFGGSITIYWS